MLDTKHACARRTYKYLTDTGTGIVSVNYDNIVAADYSDILGGHLFVLVDVKFGLHVRVKPGWVICEVLPNPPVGAPSVPKTEVAITVEV